MASFNRISLIGNVGRDPEERIVSNTKVASFSIAVNESYTKSNGEKVEKTDWFRISFWGNQAETIMKFVKKGTQIFVEGRLSASIYQDKNNNPQVALDVRGTTFTLLGSAGGTSEGGNTNYTKAEQDASKQVMEANFPVEQPGDDLPF
jgi:single-strand DNA-binding protein